MSPQSLNQGLKTIVIQLLMNKLINKLFCLAHVVSLLEIALFFFLFSFAAFILNYLKIDMHLILEYNGRKKLLTPLFKSTSVCAALLIKKLFKGYNS